MFFKKFSVSQPSIFWQQRKSLISRTLKMSVIGIYSQKNKYSKMKNYYSMINFVKKNTAL